MHTQGGADKFLFKTTTKTSQVPMKQKMSQFKSSSVHCLSCKKKLKKFVKKEMINLEF